MLLAGFFEGIGDNIIAGLLILVVGWFWGRWRAMLTWQSKAFKDRVVLALNTLQNENGKLKLTLRTLFEKDLRDVFQNESMVRIIENAIEKTTSENPLLPIDKKDSWYLLNAILNKIAEHFSSGILRRDMGLPVQSKRYTFCITYKKEASVRMQKIRIIIMQKEQFLNFPETGEISLESDRHALRIETLRILKREMEKTPHLFMDIELYQ